MKAEVLDVPAPTVVVAPVKKEKPSIIPTPNRELSARKPTIVKFKVNKDCLRKCEVPSADLRKNPDVIYHLYPTLGEWMGRVLPDGVNPRSHDPECLKSSVAKHIEQTILDKPGDFHLANRGSTIIAESLEYDSKTGMVEIKITDAENQGLADGATTDAVLAKVQTQLARELMDDKNGSYRAYFDSITPAEMAEKIPDSLKNGRIHLEVWVGLTDRDRIANLVEGRNTSRQVKGWSMSDFRQEYDWLKEIIEAPSSQFKGKVGYEENSGKDINVLDILSILTLFHPEFDEKGNAAGAPVIAYSNKGRMDARLQDEKVRLGYQKLEPLIPDILKLHDYVYANFEGAYEHSRQKARLGRRQGVKSFINSDKPYELELTGMKSNYQIPSGFIYPLLAAFRTLIVYKGDKVGWKSDPFKFFDDHGQELVSELMDQVENLGGNPNVTGKRKLVYTALHQKAELLLMKSK